MEKKLKTHSGSKKRLKRTGSGKYVHKPCNRRHLLTNKSSKRKRQLRGNRLIKPCDQREAKMLLKDDNKEIERGETHAKS